LSRWLSWADVIVGVAAVGESAAIVKSNPTGPFATINAAA
jgi:hypothetical protein